MNWLLRKILGLPFLVVFINFLLVLFAIEVFLNPLTLIEILCFNTFICIDIVIRPTSPKKDQYRRSIMALSFLALPLIMVLPYLEAKWVISQFLSSSVILWMAIISIGVTLLGGIIELLSRIQIGQYGGPKIVIEDDHRLITSGIYRYIRHPQYLGFLLLFFGYSFSMGSLLMTLIITVTFFIIFRSRMVLEEKLLISTFGEKYLAYAKRTKRLIPFVY